MTRFAGLAPFLAAADRIPGTRWLGRRIMALHWRSLGLVFGGCVAVLILAEVVEDAVEPPGRLADHLAATYPGLRDARPPLEVSVELDDAWPPEDQRYTAVGVLLRYEHDIVALVPDGRGGTTIERHRPDDGYRRFYAYVGSYWGARYSRRDDAPRSAMAVPDDATRARSAGGYSGPAACRTSATAGTWRSAAAGARAASRVRRSRRIAGT